MNTEFKVVLDNVVADAAKRYLHASDYVNGKHSSTERGKRKDKEKWEPIKNERKERLHELLELNFPEFSERFHSVQYHITKDYVTVSVKRAIPRGQPANSREPMDIDPWTP